MRFQLTTSPRFVGLALAVVSACGGNPVDRLAIPDTPDGTVRVVLEGLVQHRPEIVWRALPASYQQEVGELSREFADTVDPAVFDRAVAVARKGAVVLQNKKEIILGSETVRRSQVDPAAVDAFWEASVDMLDALLASDLADLETLRELDFEAFLASTGTALMDAAAELPADTGEMANFAEKVASWEKTAVELVSEEGDRALVRLTAPDQEPVEVPMVRVEDRWIPAELASRWAPGVAEARARIQWMNSDEAARTRVQALFGIGVVEGFIDQIDRMESSDQIDDLVGGILGNIMANQGGHAPINEG